MKVRTALLPITILAASASTVVVACGSSSDNGSNPSTDNDAGAGGDDASADDDASGHADAGSDAPPPIVLADGGDYGAVSTTYPAFTPDAPQILKGSGSVMPAPVVVTITWNSDPDQATYEAFADKIGATSYWSAVSSEYGIGALTSGSANHVRIATAPPASLGPSTMESFITSNLNGQVDGGAPWPAPTANTIYAIFLDPQTAFSDSGTNLCDYGVGGYHDTTQQNVAFAVMPHCSFFQAKDVEEGASHEYVEAATDPIVNNSAYFGFDSDHMAWEFYNQFNEEVGDACENFSDSYYQETGTFPYWVQRSWSNAAVKAGHSPCQPAPTGPYFGLTLFPEQIQSISVDLSFIGDTTRTTKGFKAKLGQSVTFQVGFYSDADAPAWSLKALVPTIFAQGQDQQGNPIDIDNGTADVTIDHGTGQNGQKAYVTITPTKAGQTKAQLIVLRPSTAQDDPQQGPELTTHDLPILIQNL